MLVRDLIARRGELNLWSIEPERSLSDMATALRVHSIGALLVQGKLGTIEGVATERDIIAALSREPERFSHLRVRDIMNPAIVSCAIGDEAMATLDRMIKNRTRYIPVLADGRAITMISIREFDTACRELRDLTQCDPLTGVANRTQIMAVLHKEVHRHQRMRAPLSVATLDVDRLSTVNYAHGRETGDALLKSLANLLTRMLRTYDCVGRIGGGAFAIVLPNTHLQDAITTCERLMREIRAAPFAQPQRDQALSVSIGLTSIFAEIIRPDDIMTETEKLLRQAKEWGRGRIVSRPLTLLPGPPMLFQESGTDNAQSA